ncbi:S-layer homology domain-containing protein [Desulfoferrobacter suflitae]|uniref:S-layer homology domain-containing protein n=1 Tax=Desulfoferrobacter suflitae TaxID=2865782 RepID=UPI002164D5A6|nr:S-layer homology domain-containing protein [Desulfoferrobacter suflitae]MCK8602606.1 S-layer homology domain-containing protein [Desulfoferrobacter suflitae]
MSQLKKFCVLQLAFFLFFGFLTGALYAQQHIDEDKGTATDYPSGLVPQQAVITPNYEESASYDGFNDVPSSYWAHEYIERLYREGITKGCGNGQYCPENLVTRAEMAIFLERADKGNGYMPPSATGFFSDVPQSHWAAGWIEQLYLDGITNGCSVNPFRYCPEYPITRAEMAVFLLRAINGSSYVPPVAKGLFADVPYDHWAIDWIEQLYIEGITTGCSSLPAKYCPENAVTRAEMAVFLVRAFDISDPNAPVSLSLLASPEVILDDGADASSITATLHPYSEGGLIPDGTVVQFEILSGIASLSSTTALTLDGVAGIQVTSTAQGTVVLQATVQGTEISGTVEINVIKSQDPNAPVSLSLLASPEVIFDDGVDASSITATLHPYSEGGLIPDGTVVQFEILSGIASLSSTTALTLDGVAGIQVTSTAQGTVVLQATVQGTEISGTVEINVIKSQDPNAPVSLSLLASPEVIFDDGVDASSITATLHPYSEGGLIPDGTVVQFEILSGIASLSSTTALTLDGVAGIQVTSTAQGTVVLQATVQGTEISGTVEINVIKSQDPNAPVSLSLLASPEVIFDDGVDASSITATLHPYSEGGLIPDGTVVQFEILSGIASLSSTTALTLDGVAGIQVTSTAQGTVVLQATVQGTEISGTVNVKVTSDFASCFTKSASSSVVKINDVFQPGSQFSLTITNTSERTFQLNRFEFTNGGILLSSTTDSSLLSDGELGGRESVGLTVTLKTSQMDKGLVASFFLTASNGQDFIVSHRFEDSPFPPFP